LAWVEDISRSETENLRQHLADRLHLGFASVDLRNAVRFTLDEHGVLHRQVGPPVDQLIWTSNRVLDRLERGVPEGLLLNGQGSAVMLLRDIREG
jgi:hypothetical protein